MVPADPPSTFLVARRSARPERSTGIIGCGASYARNLDIASAASRLDPAFPTSAQNQSSPVHGKWDRATLTWPRSRGGDCWLPRVSHTSAADGVPPHASRRAPDVAKHVRRSSPDQAGDLRERPSMQQAPPVSCECEGETADSKQMTANRKRAVSGQRTVNFVRRRIRPSVSAKFKRDSGEGYADPRHRIWLTVPLRLIGRAVCGSGTLFKSQNTYVQTAGPVDDGPPGAELPPTARAILPPNHKKRWVTGTHCGTSDRRI